MLSNHRTRNIPGRVCCLGGGSLPKKQEQWPSQWRPEPRLRARDGGSGDSRFAGTSMQLLPAAIRLFSSQGPGFDRSGRLRWEFSMCRVKHSGYYQLQVPSAENCTWWASSPPLASVSNVFHSPTKVWKAGWWASAPSGAAHRRLMHVRV